MLYDLRVASLLQIMSPAYATSYVFLAVGFMRLFEALKPYARNSPIHTSLCVTSFLQRWFTGDPRPMAFFHRYYFCHVGWKRLTKNFFHLRLPVLPCGFSLLPSVVENLTDRTPRFTHLCASLRSFKDGSLGIPGLWHSSIDITSAMLAGNGLVGLR